jgi:hypothetical protein
MELTIEHYIRIILISFLFSMSSCVSVGEMDFNPSGTLIKYIIKNNKENK